MGLARGEEDKLLVALGPVLAQVEECDRNESKGSDGYDLGGFGEFSIG